ncbi:Hypothetical protein POVR2_LOCUS292 [uncultured virus]|nr:Hypothetical protein POVR2_LOCUS292 [uncultured virus]
MDDYPTPDRFISSFEVRDEMKYLSSTAPLIVETDYLIFNIAPVHSRGKNKMTPLRGKVLLVPDSSKMDQVAGVYTGQARIRCRRSDEPLSPHDYWQENKESIYKEAGSNTTPWKLDQLLWRRVRGCGAFKPRVAAALFKLFSASRVLDFSSGWGDRLFAAISLGIQYVGVDPNPNLHGPYAKMIKELARTASWYTMIESRFQTAELPVDKTYDLVFTSPPYYDLELYATEVEGANLDEWKTRFLYPSILKAWNVLDVGGHFCISINDFSNARYVEDMCRFIDSLDGAQSLNNIYRGKITPYLASAVQTLSSHDTVTAAPLWCWQRTASTRSIELASISNPEVVIESYSIEGNRTVHVVRDDLLNSTTKFRAALPYLASYLDYNEFVYAGHEVGHGHISIALSAQILGKRATVFLQSASKSGNHLVARSRELGAKVYLIANTLKVTTEEAQKYCDRTLGALFIPLGFDTAEYQAHMVRALDKSLPADFNPARMWIVIGSGRLLRSVQELLPETRMIGLQLSRAVRAGVHADYVSEYKLSQEAADADLPPYPSSKTYDAKLWPYVLKYAMDGDYIWNVAGW